MKKILYFFGALSPLLYLSAVIIGGILWNSYSHISQPISELTADFAPRMPIVTLLFFLANLCGLLFGLGLLLEKRKNRLFKLSAVLFIILGLVSLSFYFFPQDPIGGTLTTKGLIHFVLAGIASMLTIIIVFTGAYSFDYLNFKIFSIITGFVIVISGLMTVVSTKNFSSVFGLLERITIGSYMLWFFILSIKLIKYKNED